MTVVYTHEVATGGRGFGNFVKLLFRWRGSIYKLVLPDLCVYTIIFYAINFLYRFYFSKEGNESYKNWFHQLVRYCDDVSTVVPLQFVLGFYVSQIVTRWWSQFMTIPWPDTIAVITATSLHGHDDRGRMMRRTILRYVNLCLIMVFTMISPQARSRFPTMDHLVDAGFLLPHEMQIIERLIEKLDGPKYYVPIVWAGAIATKARKEGRIRNDVALYHLIKELCKFRNMCGDLLSFDWVCIPLVYTQVVTLVTYAYFFACLFGKQLVENGERVDIYVPVFHFLEFFFLMGWLKVAETMVNPFGEDDDDFEVNWLIDRDITVSYMIVDEMNTEFPEMVKDQYWDNVVPEEMYYTETALKFKSDGYAGSAAAAATASLAPGNQSVKPAEGSIVGGTRAPIGGSLLPTHFGGQLLHQLQHHDHIDHKRDDISSVASEKTCTHLYDRTFVPRREESYESLILRAQSPEPEPEVEEAQEQDGYDLDHPDHDYYQDHNQQDQGSELHHQDQHHYHQGHRHHRHDPSQDQGYDWDRQDQRYNWHQDQGHDQHHQDQNQDQNRQDQGNTQNDQNQGQTQHDQGHDNHDEDRDHRSRGRDHHPHHDHDYSHHDYDHHE